MKKLIRFAVLVALCGAAAYGQTSCPGSGGSSIGGVQTAAISITINGTTTVIPATAGQNIHVCKVTFALSAASNITFVATNGGGNTNLTGAYQGITTFAVDFAGTLVTGLANGFGINSSAVVTGGGVMTYYLSNN